MDITYEPTFNGYPINTDREKGNGDATQKDLQYCKISLSP